MFKDLETFAKAQDANRIIKKILLSTNGIAAVKCMRSIRQWSYETFGNERVIKFLVMITPEEMEANAEYIKMADQFSLVPGGKNHNNFANVDLIVDIAVMNSADAVWAGWGHASENPDLPRKLQAKGITFLGPSADSMWLLGDKIASTLIAQTAGVPTIAWNGSGMKLDPKSCLEPAAGMLPEVYERVNVTSVDEAAECIAKIGLPVMIKASAGGGGKGIRLVNHQSELQYAFRHVQSEVPGSPIFIMKLQTNARHLEVQLLGDNHGNVISLFGRDCSVQRRHQKVLEEAPVTIATREVQIEMERAAVSLAKLVNYSSAGTVEYLFDVESKQYFFLELNPRLQVEHPCTEMITGVNLPAAQLLIGMGIALHRIKDIRLLFNQEIDSAEKFDFESIAATIMPHNHCIAARITSENPNEGFLPSSGRMNDLYLTSSASVWGYFSISSAGKIHEFSDSQFGHIFSISDTRNQARENLIIGLKELYIDSEFPTSAEYLISLIEKSEYIENEFDTSWLDDLIRCKFRSQTADVYCGVIACAIHIAHNFFTNQHQKNLKMLERGQYFQKSSIPNYCETKFKHSTTAYDLKVYKSGLTSYLIETTDGSFIEIEYHNYSDQNLLLQINDKCIITQLKFHSDEYQVIINNQSIFFEKESDPSVLKCPSSGKILKHRFSTGDHVPAKSCYMEIEVMKMVMELYTSEPGIIKYEKPVGAFLKSGYIVATLDLDNKDSVKKYNESKLEFNNSLLLETKLDKNVGDHDQRIKIVLEAIYNILNGYSYSKIATEKQISLVIDGLRSLDQRILPVQEINKLMNIMSNFMPNNFTKQLKALINSYKHNVSAVVYRYPVQKITELIHNFEASGAEMNFNIIESLTLLKDHVDRYQEGLYGYQRHLFSKILEYFVQTESLFASNSFVDCVKQLCDSETGKSAESVYENIYSHCGLGIKKKLLIRILEYLSDQGHGLLKHFTPLLEQISNFIIYDYSDIALKARAILITGSKETYLQRKNRLENILINYTFCDSVMSDEHFDQLYCTSDVISDVLYEFFYSSDEFFSKVSLELMAKQHHHNDNIILLKHDVLEDLHEKPIRLLKTYFKHPKLSVKYLKDLHIDSSSNVGLKIKRQDSSNSFDRCQIDIVTSASCTTEIDFAKISEHICENPVASEYLETEVGIFPNTQKFMILNFIIKFDTVQDEMELGKYFDSLCSKIDLGCIKHLRRITFDCFTPQSSHFIFSYRSSNGFKEDLLFRNINPIQVNQIELYKLENYSLERINVQNENIYLFIGSCFDKNTLTTEYRCFVQGIIKHQDFSSTKSCFQYICNEGERAILNTFDILDFGNAHPKFHLTDSNQIFLNFLPKFLVDNLDQVYQQIKFIIKKYEKRLWKCKLYQAELRFLIQTPDTNEANQYRIIIKTFSRIYTEINMYLERIDNDIGDIVLELVESPHYCPDYSSRRFHSLSALEPYTINSAYESRRSTACKIGTTYLYDFPTLFQKACKTLCNFNKESPNYLSSSDNFRVRSIILDENDDKKVLICDQNATNSTSNCATAAWLIQLVTNEFPNGRPLVLIGNDITHNYGSITIADGKLFCAAVEYAIKNGYPVTYVSCNSGASIAASRKVYEKFKIKWTDSSSNSSVGLRTYDYFYLDQEDYDELKDIVIVEKINDDVRSSSPSSKSFHYKLISIIGESAGGVSTLSICGKMAGTMSYAYSKIFTCSIVTQRSVGIGAYLARLSQRIIQVGNSPMLLTGVRALNELLGREVYIDNKQLGGPEIMLSNGIAHSQVDDDYMAVLKILCWISYIPPTSHLLMTDLFYHDDLLKPKSGIENKSNSGYMKNEACNDVQAYLPMNSNFDSRKTIESLVDPGSFEEIMASWAKGIIVGRATLNKMPIGLIFGNNHATEEIIPSDPADPTSIEKVNQVPARVLFPDSSFKFAQAIEDFNREQLPLVIYCNFRGFSGGMRDMHLGILKYGSYIVDALNKYKYPIINYIGPYCELRGGSWVVLDPSINRNQLIEMYASSNSLGSIMEPSGILGLKYRDKTLFSLLKRYSKDLIGKSDCELKDLDVSRGTLNKITLDYIELHDNPHHMLATGAINAIIDFRQAKSFFFWNLACRQKLQSFVNCLMNKCEALVDQHSLQAILADIVESMCPELSKMKQLSPRDYYCEELMQFLCDNTIEIDRNMRRACRALIDSKIKGIIDYLGIEQNIELEE